MAKSTISQPYYTETEAERKKRVVGGLVPLIASYYPDAFRPCGLAGTFLDGQEPIVGDPSKPKPELASCRACKHLKPVQPGVKSYFECRKKLVRQLTETEAVCIMIRCTERTAK